MKTNFLIGAENLLKSSTVQTPIEGIVRRLFVSRRSRIPGIGLAANVHHANSRARATGEFGKDNKNGIGAYEIKMEEK